MRVKTIISEEDQLYICAVDLAKHCLEEAQKVKQGLNKKALLDLGIKLVELQEELSNSKRLVVVTK